MKLAWMQKTLLAICLAIPAQAAEQEENKSLVVAMDAKHGNAVHAGDITTASSEGSVLVNKQNLRVELSPHSVGEFDESGQFKLLRGSALLDSKTETSMRTAGTQVDFVGKTLVSYDYKDQSSSAFVLEGEARLVNPHRKDATLRLERFRGATFVVGDVLPHMIRQLDVGAVNDWLAGYSWPENRRKGMLRGMPGETVAVTEKVPEHLEETKIEDYFSSIDTADEWHQPEYYQKKFDDPDKVIAEQNSKSGAKKELTPEEAALIALPKTHIDLGFNLGPEFLSAEQKQKEVAGVAPKKTSRMPASIAPKKAARAKKKMPEAEQGDPAINLVLSRLKQVRADNTVNSHESIDSRAPASVAVPVVPDPVYDYSQNF